MIGYCTRPLPQHILSFFPLPHGHGALRPICTLGDDPAS